MLLLPAPAFSQSMTTTTFFLLPFFSLPFFLLFSFNVYAAAPPTSSPPALRVSVPLKTGFTEFITWSGTPSNATFDGFCIQVFEAAIKQLNPRPSYQYIPFGDGIRTPVYNDMISLLQKKEDDVVVGDLTITKERMESVDFTQPFTQSALVVVTPARYASHESMWDFLRPFSWQLWAAIGTAFFGTGFVMLIIERSNSDFEGSWSTRLYNVFWFISLTLFFAQREGIKTKLGRLVTVLWLVVVLIFTSSYTANLSSSLMLQRLSPEIKGFESLKKMNVPVGYQEGSFTKDYLIRLGITEKRLVPLSSETEFANALRLGPRIAGGVAAIVDELPYVTKFLSSNCDFTTVGDQIAYFGGFGFAVQKNSSLTEELSMAILSVAQDGTIQKIHNGWLGTRQCSTQTTEDHLKLRNFGGLFIILAVVYTISVVWHVGRSIWLTICESLTHIMYIFMSSARQLWPHPAKQQQVSPEMEMGSEL